MQSITKLTFKPLLSYQQEIVEEYFFIGAPCINWTVLVYITKIMFDPMDHDPIWGRRLTLQMIDFPHFVFCTIYIKQNEPAGMWNRISGLPDKHGVHMCVRCVRVCYVYDFTVTSVDLFETRTGQELAGYGGIRFGVVDRKQILFTVHAATPLHIIAVIPTMCPYRAIRHTLQVQEIDISLMNWHNNYSDNNGSFYAMHAVCFPPACTQNRYRLSTVFKILHAWFRRDPFRV